MVTPEEYLLNPCGMLSVPLWKWRQIQVPPTMRIVHERDYRAELAVGFRDTVYFRLMHDLRKTPAPVTAGFILQTAKDSDLPQIVSIINRSYDDLRVTAEEVLSYTKRNVYAPGLWLMAKDAFTGSPMGCALADYDREIGEICLEWIQVLPRYRRRGVGTAMVQELIHRKPEGAKFATVSGSVENPTSPEALYRHSGFTGQDYWHIMTPLEGLP